MVKALLAKLRREERPAHLLRDSALVTPIEPKFYVRVTRGVQYAVPGGE